MQQYYYKIAKSRCERVDSVSMFTAFTCRLMGRQNESTKRLRSIFTSSSLTDKLTGVIGSLSLNLHITTEYIARLARAHSWSSMGVTQWSSPIPPDHRHSWTQPLKPLSKTWLLSTRRPRGPSKKQQHTWRHSMTRNDVLHTNTKSATEHGLMQQTYICHDQRKSLMTNALVLSKSWKRQEHWHTSSSYHPTGRSIHDSMRSCWHLILHQHSPTKNFHCLLLLTSSKMKTNTKSKKFLTHSPAGYEARRDESIKWSPTTSSNGRDGQESITLGSETRRWNTCRKWFRSMIWCK